MANFGIKDLYEGTLLAIDNVDFGETHFSKDDVIFHIENMMSLNLQGQDSTSAARGGYENPNLIDWSKITNVQGLISMGVVDKIAMSLSLGFPLQSKKDSLLIPMVENLFVDQTNVVFLKQKPFGQIKVFEKVQGNRTREILNFQVQENTLTLEENGIDIEIDYSYKYEQKSDFITVGNPLLEGYFKFVGKFYYTDEITQEQKTGIIEIPKLKFLQNVKIGLGRNTTPTISDLYFSVEPQGERRNKRFFNLYFLGNKI